MYRPSRRQFLEWSSWGVASLAAGHLLRAQSGNDAQSQLFIHGGTVIDPANGIHAKRDVRILNGRIHEIAENLPVPETDRLMDATGLLVVPGLVDLHAHVGAPGDPLGLPIDTWTARTGVTTCVSAGDVGAPDWPRFREQVLDRLQTRTFAFLHISNRGLQHFPEPEMLDLADIAVDRTAETLANNPDLLLGIKVREGSAIVGENGIEPLRRAIAAAERASAGARVMCHIGDAPGSLSDLLNLMRPGDIVTHTFSALGNNIVQNGRLLPAALEAQARGVIFDVGHGGGSFNFDIAEAALDQGLRPDTISSDLHRASIDTPGNPFLPWVMSKFMALGFSLDEVIAMATHRPAAIIDRVPGLGTLSVGAPADLTLLELKNEPTDFVDTNGNRRAGSRHLRSSKVIKGGHIIA